MCYQLSDMDLGDFKVIGNRLEDSWQPDHVHQLHFNTSKGNIHYLEQPLRKQMAILEGNYAMTEDVLLSGKGEGCLLEIQINLSGNDIHYKNRQGKERKAAAGSVDIVFLSAEDNEARILFKKDRIYNTYDVHLPLSTLERYGGESRLMDSFLEQIAQDKSVSLLQDRMVINKQIYHIIQEMKCCRFEGLTKRIYLESKTYELIALLYDRFEHQQTELNLSHVDKDKIHEAAAMIRENLDAPLTINQLSRKVAINQTKLKAGFKVVLGTTVFGYLQEIRMQNAKTYLLNTNESVKDIAIRSGYKNISNFSNAFKRIYGFSPIKFRSDSPVDPVKQP